MKHPTPNGSVDAKTFRSKKEDGETRKGEADQAVTSPHADNADHLPIIILRRMFASKGSLIGALAKAVRSLRFWELVKIRQGVVKKLAEVKRKELNAIGVDKSELRTVKYKKCK